MMNITYVSLPAQIHFFSRTALTLCLFLIALSAFSAPIMFVDEKAVGANTGDSWNDAFTDLQDALLSINSGEIWVAAGSYKPGSTRTDTFNLRNNVALYGGFSGTETALEQRDMVMNITILNGDLLDDDYYRFVNGHAVWSNAGDNSNHIVSGINVNDTAVLDGFVIAHGWAISAGGGGLLIRSGSPTIINTRIDGSSGYVGGGASVEQASAPSFTNCEFRDNSGDIGFGGAMYITGASNVTFSNCHFEGNAAIGTQSPAGSGGALYVDFGSSVSIIGSSFVRNITGYRTNTTDGTNPTTGGAIMAGGDVSVRDSTFIANKSHMGGAIYAYNGLTLINNIFNGNAVTTAPGSAGGGYGGAIVLLGPSSVTNNTITSNSATEGTGGVIASVAVGESIVIANSILWGNTVSKPIVPGEDLIPLVKNQFTSSGDVVISYGILEGLYQPITGEDPVNPNSFPGVLDTDPLFVNQAGLDGYNGNEDDDLHLGTNSPAIDSGDNSAVTVGITTDIGGDLRFQDDLATVDTGNGTAPIVDMGAYEVAGLAGDNIPPVASASASPLSGEVPLDVQFSSLGSGDADGQVITYNWDFGNGNSSTEVNPWFSYQFAGIYTAILTVTDDLGTASTDSVIITVTEPVINQAPVAVVSADLTTGEAPLVVELNGSFSPDDNQIVSYVWDFGDGTTATGDIVIHTYDSGIYTATLTVTDDQNLTAAASISITVDPVIPPVDNTIPAAPTNLMVNLVKTGKGKNKVVTAASVNWIDNSNNETGFVVESCLEQTTGKGKNKVISCNFTERWTTGANTTTQSVLIDSDYRYRVKAINVNGSSGYTNEVLI